MSAATLRDQLTRLKDAAGLWSQSNAFAYAGALAFYTLFSLAPVALIAITVVGMVLGPDAAEGQLVGQLEGTIGPEAARAIENAVEQSRIQESGLLPTLTGIGALLVGATTVFAQMQIAFDAIWGVAPRPTRSTLIILLAQRVLSLAVVLCIGFVLLVSLLVHVALQAVIAYAEQWLPFSGILAGAAELILSLVIITGLFALLFRLLPDVVLTWRDVLPAAFLTAVLFAIGRSLLGLYLSLTAPASAYGAAGSLVLVMLWVYYSSLILLYGVAFARTQKEARGEVIEPNQLAARVRRELVT